MNLVEEVGFWFSNSLLSFYDDNDERDLNTMNKEDSQLPMSRGKTYILRVISIYYSLFEDKYGFKPTLSIPRYGRQVKRLLATHNELQIAALLIVFFDWAGMDGSDNYTAERLTNSTHPFGWFFSTTNSYEAYLRNVMGLNFDNLEEVRKFVAKSMSSLQKK